MKTLYAALLVSGLMLAQGALAGTEAAPAAPAQPAAQTAAQPASPQGGQPVKPAGKVEKKAEKKEGEVSKSTAPVVEKK
ncbi:MAG: hypothetical protein G8345_19410 [Magnetococcales bacterium]|nr:hypothetical protein [Magnetococcales bacterium]NGZ29045.1 hypothetical protein [Magnetococcales bacterium]